MAINLQAFPSKQTGCLLMHKQLKNCIKISNILLKLYVNLCENEISATRNESNSLFNKPNEFETVVNLVVWDKILQHLNFTNKTAQNHAVNFSTFPKFLLL